MESKKLQIIQELMSQLAEEMEYTPDDLGSRLGRHKPEGVMEIKIEGKGMPALEKAEELVGEDLDGDMEEGESPMHKSKVFGGMDDEEEELGPEEMLAKRIKRLRG